MKKLVLILALMFCMIFSFNALAFEKVDVTMVNCGLSTVYVPKIQTLIDFGLGSSTTAVPLLDDDPALTVYATCDQTSGTVQSSVISLVVGGAGTIVEGLHVVVSTEYMSGSWINAIVGKLAFGTTGSAGGGMAAPICAELNLPAQALPGGSYYNVHSYLNVPTSCTLIDSSSFNVTFERYELAGGAKGEFDDYGDFFHIVGLTPADSHVLSEGYTTLRCLIDTYDKYLVLSRIENGLGMGASGDALNLDADTPLFQLYTTGASVAASGNTSAYIQQTMTVDSAVNWVEALKVEVISDVKTGPWVNAIFGRVNYTENGWAYGSGSAVCGEMSLAPGGSHSGQGTYTVFQAELDVPASAVGIGSECSFIRASVWGDQSGLFDDSGFAFVFTGIQSGSAHLWYDKGSAITPGDASEWLRIKTPGGTRYLMLYDSPS